MSFWGVTILEFLGCLFVIWATANEEKLKVFEQNVKCNVKRIVLGNYRHWKRTRGKQK